MTRLPTGRDEPESPRRHRLVVVGNGMAGVRSVEEILTRAGPDRFDITVFGDEPYGNYNRILLSNVLAGHEDEAEIFLNSLSWYEENGIRLRAGVRVTRVDRDAKRVYADDGSTTEYDTLILATGSRPFFPPIEGLRRADNCLKAGVFAFRTIDDVRAMVEFARSEQQGHRTAVVIGGGLLGLEAARGLQNYGLDVHVVHATPTLMNQQLDEQPGAILRGSVEALGITVHTDARTTAILGDEHVTGIAFDDGTVVPCDMVVVTAGIRPNVELAQVSDLTVERGIVTDDQMRCIDAPEIYAVGECAQHRGEVYGLVAPLWEQAVVLADHLTGANPDAAYHGSRLATKLKVAGVDVAAMGVKAPQRPDDEYVVVCAPQRGVYKSVVVRDGKLVGATLLGDVGKVAFLMQAFDRQAPLPEERAELLFDLGTPPAEVGAAELADDAQVCNCNGVCKADLVACVQAGEKSVTGVMNATRAGKGCGSCKGLVQQIVEWAAGGEVEENPTAHYYVPGIPMDKPTLMAAIRAQGLRSVSAVFAALAPGGAEDAASKVGLASLLRVMWGKDYIDEHGARFSATACTPTSSATEPSRSSRRSRVA